MKPPRARFVPPPVMGEDGPEAIVPLVRGEDGKLSIPESFPLPPVEGMGVWSGEEPRAHLPPDRSYLQPTHREWEERRRAESNVIVGLAAIVILGVCLWVVWLVSA